MPIFSSFSAGGGVRSAGFGIGRAAGSSGPGEAVFTSPTTHTWTVPAGVTSVHVVAIGAGAAGTGDNSWGGGGGGLGWRNNIAVNPGSNYTVVVGAGTVSTGPNQGRAGSSYFINTSTVRGQGGTVGPCLLYTSPSPRDGLLSRMPSSA